MLYVPLVVSTLDLITIYNATYFISTPHPADGYFNRASASTITGSTRITAVDSWK